MIQIRHVPEDVHRRLKARAAMEGVSLSELALAELRRSLERPTRRELLERHAQPGVPPTTGDYWFVLGCIGVVVVIAVVPIVFLLWLLSSFSLV